MGMFKMSSRRGRSHLNRARVPRRRAAQSGRPSDGHNVQRILKVAECLFATKGYRGTTVRDIAQAAHVTHPLIYHYWGSKRGLLAAVLERSQARMRAVADIGGDPLEVFARLARDNLIGNRLYLLTMTRAFADGMRASAWPGGFPAAEIILDRVMAGNPQDRGLTDAEARERVAIAVAVAMGWVLVEDQLLEIVGLPPEYRDETRERVVGTFEDILRPALAPDRG